MVAHCKKCTTCWWGCSKRQQGYIRPRALAETGSPDNHKVYEHGFDIDSASFGRGLWLLPSFDDMHFYSDWCGILREMDPMTIQADIDSLQRTYRDIIDHGGVWATQGNN